MNGTFGTPAQVCHRNYLGRTALVSVPVVRKRRYKCSKADGVFQLNYHKTSFQCSLIMFLGSYTQKECNWKVDTMSSTIRIKRNMHSHKPQKFADNCPKTIYLEKKLSRKLLEISAGRRVLCATWIPMLPSSHLLMCDSNFWIDCMRRVLRLIVLFLSLF